MKLLLDTHIWIWSVLEPNLLRRSVRTKIANAANELWLSPLSLWEFFMLCRKGRLVLDDKPQAWLSRTMLNAPLKEAPLTFDVVLETGNIEALKLDPVDRFLIATARTLELTLVSADREIIKTSRCSVLPNR